ncbi:MAG: hypothetical protein QG597_2164 [Actinomycetota bacterium]|nr:hypothetical protein [Actinomycetota bacterium]
MSSHDMAVRSTDRVFIAHGAGADWSQRASAGQCNGMR